MEAQLLAEQIKTWGRELGFQQLAISDLDLAAYQRHLERWLAAGRHGSMGYMARNVEARLNPEVLVPGTARVITARMDYLPAGADPIPVLEQRQLGYVSRYALGRDYHKVVRRRLRDLAARITAQAGGQHRAFTNSAPVLEKALAEKAGLGWIGKHTVLIHQDAGSWFFLGEVFTDIPLPVDVSPTPAQDPCGRCRACITVCPTNAIVGPRELDAQRCISYLTIEHRGAIPVALRSAIGNRIFGCDDCQLFCPWNRYAKQTVEPDFAPRHGLDAAELIDLLSWSEQDFLDRTQGSALRRIKYWQWLRNVAVAIGNAPADPRAVAALEKARCACADIDHESIVLEHIDWALAQQRAETLV
jgi:epoxyqueuosine reductase